ncbi:MAG: hypothetical protein PHU77_05140 [Simplicispira sp.]|nr:hypothetical protein [Simplicispira sp.]
MNFENIFVFNGLWRIFNFGMDSAQLFSRQFQGCKLPPARIQKTFFSPLCTKNVTMKLFPPFLWATGSLAWVHCRRPVTPET